MIRAASILKSDGNEAWAPACETNLRIDVVVTRDGWCSLDLSLETVADRHIADEIGNQGANAE
jgi:hypothetical protein